MKEKKLRIPCSIWLLIFAFSASAQEPNLAEKLGYAKDARLLIVHADDIGVTASVNRATIKAYENGGINSGSIMVPCPWFGDFAAYCREHPGLDVGIHITLTAEWKNYKWDGVSSSGDISSLLDEQGNFYPSEEELGRYALASEVEKEIRAQIERAMAFGITPTHLDNHMGSLAVRPDLIEIYMRLGMEYGLPFLMPRAMLGLLPEQYREQVLARNIPVDGLFELEETQVDADWPQAYEDFIKQMVPGLNQLIVHLAEDDAEMRSVTVNHPDYGSAWRQKDLDYVSSPEFRELLKAHDIQLVGWKEIKALL